MQNPFRTEKSNWDMIEGQDIRDTVKYRDVYNEQQLGRKRPEERQTAFSRTLGSVMLGIVSGFLGWIFTALVEFLIYISRTGQSVISGYTWTGQGPGHDYMTGFGGFMAPDWLKVFWGGLVALVIFGIVQALLMRNLKAQNALSDPSDINEYYNDQHIALPEEIQRKFDYFPDAGAHSSVLVSSMISHMALKNKGLKSVTMYEQTVDDDDDSEFYAAIDNKTDQLKLVKKPMIDTDFQDDLFEASGVPKEIRKAYDATKIPYNPNNKNRNKMKGYDTVADAINGDWELPLYEPQRPAGAYLVDTDPVNTMVLAITRAGKGQTVIEPTIDMWLREKTPNNIVINDPKGELLVEFYVPAAVRGFQPVQFNLINSMKTDIYNPLVMAAQSAREGDSTKAAQYVENIADVFFPQTEGEDPVWANSANNAFKRAAYGLIDYYLEEEIELRNFAARTGMDAATLDTAVDNLWGHVTLYNCYQLFVQLTSKKVKNPAVAFKKAKDAGEYDQMDEDEYAEKLERVNAESALWDNQAEVDELTLFFNATARLPRNSVRTLVANADNALRAMGGADKMIASVYGIALTAMSFFSDPTISTLTSGTPSQNVDLAGLSFPRRIGVQFHPDFLRRYHLIGLQCRWQAYADPDFTKSLGKDFYHEDLIGREGWARMYFKGIFPEMSAYLKMEIHNPETGALVKTFFFRFDKAYQTSLDGRYYVKDPVLNEKIIKNGSLTELVAVKQRDGSVIYRPGRKAFYYKQLSFEKDKPEVVTVQLPAIKSNLVRYAEKPKIVFMVTPPHLMKYAKLILILVRQLVDLNFEQSYMTKSNQKPLYKTRFMLDELGNLQSEGHGINGFETMLSIGLGQEQQFTLILQTLQQLRDVYGDSVDKIVQGNAQPLDTMLATPQGWKAMGDIEIGDEVLTPDGVNAQVTGVYPRGKRKIYLVRLADGRQTRACGEHLWNVDIVRK